MPGSIPSGGGASLFASVIQKAGGDPVSLYLFCISELYLHDVLVDPCKTFSAKAPRPVAFTIPSTRRSIP